MPAPSKNDIRNLIVAVIVGVLGATGGPLMVVKLGGPSIYRQDPFTGTEANELKEEVKDLRSYVQGHLDTHPDRRLELEITRINGKLDAIMYRLDRME